MLSCFSTGAMPAMCSVAGRARSQRGQSGGCSLWQVKSQALRQRGEQHPGSIMRVASVKIRLPKQWEKLTSLQEKRKGMNGQRIRPNAASCCPSSHCQACLTGPCEGHSGVPPQVAWNMEVFNCHRVQWKRRRVPRCEVTTVHDPQLSAPTPKPGAHQSRGRKQELRKRTGEGQSGSQDYSWYSTGSLISTCLRSVHFHFPPPTRLFRNSCRSIKIEDCARTSRQPFGAARGSGCAQAAATSRRSKAAQPGSERAGKQEGVQPAPAGMAAEDRPPDVPSSARSRSAMKASRS